MTPPDINNSTREERLDYVRSKWECMHNCELCGKCHIRPTLTKERNLKLKGTVFAGGVTDQGTMTNFWAIVPSR